MNERLKELMVKASSGACYDEPGSVTLYNVCILLWLTSR